MTLIRLGLLPRPGQQWRELAVTTPGRAKSLKVLVVPGEGAVSRWLEVKGSTTAQIGAAARLQIADDLAQPLGDCAVALGAAHDGRRQVCVVANNDLAAWKAEAASHGFIPDAIVPDYALLALPDEDAIAAAQIDGETIAGGPGVGFACQPELASLLLQDRDTQPVDFDERIVRCARQNALSSAPNFAARSGEGAAGGLQERALHLAAVAALALLVGSLAPWVHALRIDASAASMRKQATRIAAETLPDAPQIRDARAQLLEPLRPFTHSRKSVELSLALFDGLAQAPGVLINRLEVDPDGQLLAALSVSSPSDLDPVQASLAGAGYRTSQTQGATAAGRTTIDLVVTDGP
ncbi:MAG: type II secretion system protein GspL [Hyphomonadaceae bacterium]